jgi:hypothetical protein
VKFQILYRAEPILMGKAWIRYDKVRIVTLALLFFDKTRDKYLSRSIFNI